MRFKMNKNILALSLFSAFSLTTYTQETASVSDVDLLTESINISTDSLENSALTQEQINKLDETTRILLADYQSTSKEYESFYGHILTWTDVYSRAQMRKKSV